MELLDVVLFNDCGCEIARETVTDTRTECDIISSWIIRSGDRIEIQETWHEE